MTQQTFVTLLEIQVVTVALVDCSGFYDWLKARLAGWLHVRGGISLKPFDCSLCMTHWTGLVWMLASGQISLTGYMVLCLLAIATPVTQKAIAFTIYSMQRLIDYGEKII